MCTRSKVALFTVLALAPVTAQQRPDPRSSFKIDLPGDSPVSLLSADWGESRASARGGAMVLDLRTSLSLRNSSPRRIRGITLLVLAQEVTPGGKGSVSVPSLDVGPQESFSVKIDLRLLRPLQNTSGPLVKVLLDGVLFDDLGFYGPNQLNSRRSMLAWEMEARRDRQYLKAVLAAKGQEALQREVLATLAGQADRPTLDVQVASKARATNFQPEREVQFAFLRFPDSPVEPVGGLAQIAGNEARAPRVEVRNRSARPIKYLEIGWILRDGNGREFLAGSVPADLSLGPGQKTQVLQDSTLRFTPRSGPAFAITGMTGFVSQVEFGDGAVWVPSRTAAVNDARSRGAMAPSPEEQRLAELYRRRGLAALVAELSKF